MPTASFNLINCEIDTSSKLKCDSKTTHTTGTTNAFSKMWSSDTLKTFSNTINSFKPKFSRLDSTGEDTSHSPVRVITKDAHRNNRKTFQNHQSWQRVNRTRSSFNPTKFGLKNNFSGNPLTSNYSMERAASVYHPLWKTEKNSTNFIGTNHAPGLFHRYHPLSFLPNKAGKAHPYLHPDSPWLKVNSGYSEDIRRCNSPNIVKNVTQNNITSKVNCMKSINQNNTHRKTDKHKHSQSQKCASFTELNGMAKDSVTNCDSTNTSEETRLEKLPCEGIQSSFIQQCSSVIDQIQLEETVLMSNSDSDTAVMKKTVADIPTSDEIKKTISVDSSDFLSCDNGSDNDMTITNDKKSYEKSQEELSPCFKNEMEPIMAATFSQSPSSSEMEDIEKNFIKDENIPNHSVNKSCDHEKVFDDCSNGIENTKVNAEINDASKDTMTKSASQSSKVDQKSCTICTAYITRMTPERTDFPKSAGCQHSIILVVRDKSKKIKKHRPKEKHEKQSKSSDKSFIVGVKSASSDESPVNSHVFTFMASDTSDTDESWDSFDDDDAEESKDLYDGSMEDFLPQTLMNPLNFRVQISTMPDPSSASNCKASPTTSLIDSLNASWNIQIVNSKKTKDTKCPAKPSKERKVQFKNDDELVVVHDMCKWSYDDYQAARKGPWEQYARDRDRFRRRIQEVDEKISSVLSEKHRTKVYDTYFK